MPFPVTRRTNLKHRRLGNEGVKDRIENLYFAYLFVLRAVMKAGPYLESVQYTTGMADQDSRSLELVRKLVLFFSRLSPSIVTLWSLFEISLSNLEQNAFLCPSFVP